MQLQGLMLFLFMIIAIPILIIFANHNVFFILISIILFYTSLRNVYNKLFKFEAPTSESEEDLSEEFEQTMNLNAKKFKDGISVCKNLIIILFLIYCTYIISDFYIKVGIALLLTFRLANIFNSLTSKKAEINNALYNRFKTVLPLLMDILTAAVIIIISIKKYFNFFI